VLLAAPDFYRRYHCQGPKFLIHTTKLAQIFDFRKKMSILVGSTQYIRFRQRAMKRDAWTAAMRKHPTVRRRRRRVRVFQGLWLPDAGSGAAPQKKSQVDFAPYEARDAAVFFLRGAGAPARKPLLVGAVPRSLGLDLNMV